MLNLLHPFIFLKFEYPVKYYFHKGMTNRFIDRFDVILLDMGYTFMFDVDRFGEDEDYHATYRNLGGRSLTPEEVRAPITEVLDLMLSAARDPKRVDDFGDVRRFLRESGAASELPPLELDLIVKVFSRHELGSIPPGHAEALRRLRSSHPLGLVSNVWSPSDVFESALESAGIRDLFTVRVWSSDYLSIKPSARLFQIALDAFPSTRPVSSTWETTPRETSPEQKP